MPLEFIKPGTLVRFLNYRKFAYLFSGTLFTISIISFFFGINFGIDFLGGTELHIKFNKPVRIHKLRKTVESLKLGDVVIQRFGEMGSNAYLVRVEKTSSKLKGGVSDVIKGALAKRFGEGSFKIIREETIGPKVGSELRKKGIEAIIFALIGILIYIAFRFEFSFAVGAVLALVHDVTITAGTMNLMHREFTLDTIAALLTIVGYSLNDTIVVFDRIRENMRKLKEKSKNLSEIMDISISETLSRTVLTSFTTLLVVLALLVLGGDIIRNFALALFIGIIIGTYSSIFVASPLVLAWENYTKKRTKKKARARA